VIDNDVHVFGRKCPLRLSQIYYWPEGSNFASAARGQRYFKFDIFTPQVSTQARANILSGS